MRPRHRLARLCAPTLVALGLSGCIYMQTPRVELVGDTEQSAEQILGTYLLFSTLGFGGGGGASDAQAGFPSLVALYPVRAQLVTYAIIGFHREHGSWPSDADALRAYAEASPANPRLSSSALEGFQLEVRESGDCTYSTVEDRQRGRYFTLTTAYRLTMPVPAALFASPNAPELPRPAGGSTVSVDWNDLAPAFSRALGQTPSAPPAAH